MALVRTCSRCGRSRVIDTFCSGSFEYICFGCFDNCNDLAHKPGCHVAAKRLKDKRRAVAKIHDEIDKQRESIGESMATLEALVFSLRIIDPCPECKGINHESCRQCNQLGYGPKPSQEMLEEELPPTKY
ncbi:MAG: hypothetical protein Q7K65_05585 [Candidatus Buchananbacteria bacterium]|nr:hypothetical protein [Candidatus Buchananbacteria bacterium]